MFSMQTTLLPKTEPNMGFELCRNKPTAGLHQCFKSAQILTTEQAKHTRSQTFNLHVYEAQHLTHK